jgi:phosphoadenosine phosphosulfate reductase
VLSRFNRLLAGFDLLERLRWASQTYDNGLAMVSSFGPSSIVILDHLVKIQPDVRVMTIDTQMLFPETYTLIQDIREFYPTIQVQVVQPALSLEQHALEYGEELWKNEPDLCCHLRKVTPLAEALANQSAWIAGIRRDQSRSRNNTPFVQWDTRCDLIKLAPVADWSQKRVWDYIRQHHLPYNALHDRRYSSIGCIHCTRPVKSGEEMRAGRWDRTDKVECGLHIPIGKTPERLRCKHSRAFCLSP